MKYLVAYAKKLIPVAMIAATYVCLTPQTALAQVFISVRIGPPALPVYVQPPCPEPGYLWTPGYWAYGPMGYYWVPGVWVEPPVVGVLWTPGWWGWSGGLYVWHGGYWGPHVGFYGGINYGFGYGGAGYVGGGWVGGQFRYNTAVTNVNTTVVKNVYVNNTVINNTTTVVNNSRTSFNGPGGVTSQPTAQERTYANEQHFQPTGHQLAHLQTASQDRSQWASTNHGQPSVASMSKVNGQRFDPNARTAHPPQQFGHGPQIQASNVGRPQPNFSPQANPQRPAYSTPPANSQHPQASREQPNHIGERASAGVAPQQKHPAAAPPARAKERR